MTDSTALKHAPSLVLASASPRRRELLRYLTPDFVAVATRGEEEDRPLPPALARTLPPFDLDPETHPAMLAWRKAAAASEGMADGVVLGADTIVVVDGDVLGKPSDDAEARLMLRRLAGRTHRVYTGLAGLCVDRPAELRWALEWADVRMSELSDGEIAGYVATGEPMDKAGAYGIQGLGGRLVQDVWGSYTCVVGLPLRATHALLLSLGISALVDPDQAVARWLADGERVRPPSSAP